MKFSCLEVGCWLLDGGRNLFLCWLLKIQCKKFFYSGKLSMNRILVKSMYRMGEIFCWVCVGMYGCVHIFGDFHDVSVRKLWKICASKLRDIYDQDSLKFHFTKWSHCQVEPQTANKMLSTNKLTTGQSPQHIPRKQFPFIGLSGQILIFKASLLMEEKICLLTQTKVLQQCQSKLHKRTRQKSHLWSSRAAHPSWQALKTSRGEQAKKKNRFSAKFQLIFISCLSICPRECISSRGP